MRTERELLVECLKQLKHIDDVYNFAPLGTTLSLITEVEHLLAKQKRENVCPICDSDKVYITEAHRCKRCGTTLKYKRYE
jgi:ribosomal protein L37AE/L43A